MNHETEPTRAGIRTGGAIAATMATVTVAPAAAGTALFQLQGELVWAAIGWTGMTALLSGALAWRLAPRLRGSKERDKGAMPVIALGGVVAIPAATMLAMALMGRIG